MIEKYVDGTQPVTDDRAFYTSCGIQLRAPFADLQRDYDRWAAVAASGGHTYGRYSWTICGFAKASPSPTSQPSPGQPTLRPTRKR